MYTIEIGQNPQNTTYIVIINHNLLTKKDFFDVKKHDQILFFSNFDEALR